MREKEKLYDAHGGTGPETAVRLVMLHVALASKWAEEAPPHLSLPLMKRAAELTQPDVLPFLPQTPHLRALCYQGLAQLLYSSGDYQGASKIAALAVKMLSVVSDELEVARGRMRLGACLLALGKYEEALAEFKLAIPTVETYCFQLSSAKAPLEELAVLCYNCCVAHALCERPSNAQMMSDKALQVLRGIGQTSRLKYFKLFKSATAYLKHLESVARQAGRSNDLEEIQRSVQSYLSHTSPLPSDHKSSKKGNSSLTRQHSSGLSKSMSAASLKSPVSSHFLPQISSARASTPINDDTFQALRDRDRILRRFG
eukprot:GILI01021546.1.p1 GENE.GILI01021546.1~~GILI01021546.1.p1  ORF type:complete len:362 (+),score=62.76 GILI01021546.1:147-1088(+)